MSTGPSSVQELPPPTPLSPGMVLDGFRLEERLHQGGMANLWRVSRVQALPDDEMPLIMKVPRIKGGEDPATIVGFEVEQMLIPVLKGPHVPRFVARGDWTRQAYIVMERIEGESLRPRLDEAPLSVDEVVDIGQRVAAALHDLHRQHVVHLDIKPSNIMFRPDGSAVLVDFGLSRHDHLPDLLEEEFELPMGTGPYMSPEQVQFVRNDPRSDLFALGVMLYHLATGERPFGQPSSVRGLRRRLYVEPLPPRAIRPELPPWLQEVILHCLEVKPERRYQSAAQLALDLQRPESVTLTARAHKLERSGALKAFKRWFFALGHEPQRESASSSSVDQQLSRSPIIMAAVDTQSATPALLARLQETARRLVHAEPGARLACVSVMKTARIGMDELTDAQGRSVHVKQLIALKHWARPISRALSLEDARLTFHVLEAPDAAQAIIEFAAKAGVDHIVMGARANSALRRYLGSVSAQVVAEAECSVTVVRAPG
ncbi:MAG: serine/threonine protein kinase [Roseateles asaccharophilus]|uniref:Serine/threonine protein kinase n=1 Tax=Roseateles asaccharophilus TaxID=582607 RepID=A0A4R6MWU0_9BURK|nr:bifunctional serine/threonine-protein kinase/universal stress protein [Roseateles asaccharophilus]MDN3545873.1 bifunctional serine/threonine-protein kinase/universal stress protein [Roseateles asaccharophilus]TDP06670.1 serine/threonine protein kinase [Roseateles asaccharophilus]